MRKIKLFAGIAVLMALLSACKEPMEEITETSYPRPFSPIDLTQTPSTFDKTVLEWKPIDGASKYVVELSQGDSLLFNNIIYGTETELTRMEINNLWGEMRYSARVKAKPFAEGQTDSKWAVLTWESPAEQIFKPIKLAEVKGTSLTVRFAIPDGDADKLTVEPSGGASTDVPLTAPDKTAGFKVLTGLTPSKTYTISIWEDTKKRGEVKTKMRWKPGEGAANVVMVSLGEDLKTICEDAANVGKIIYLPDGYTYANADPAGGNMMQLAGSMDIIGDPDAVAPPKLTYISTSGGGRFFLLPVEADTITFANIDLESDAEKGNSLFDQDLNADATRILKLTRLRVENCRVSNIGRSIIRLRNNTNGSTTPASPIELLSVSDCIFKNVGASGSNQIVIDARTASGGIDKIELTNSTFYGGVSSDFISAADPSTVKVNDPVKSINIENCTFDDFLGNGRVFITAGNNTGLTATIRSCIFGKTKGEVKQFSVGAGSTVTATNCFRTEDHTTTAANDFASGATKYEGASTALWTNTADGDFSFKDAAFAGKNTTGDPRWR